MKNTRFLNFQPTGTAICLQGRNEERWFALPIRNFEPIKTFYRENCRKMRNPSLRLIASKGILDFNYFLDQNGDLSLKSFFYLDYAAFIAKDAQLHDLIDVVGFLVHFRALNTELMAVLSRLSDTKSAVKRPDGLYEVDIDDLRKVLAPHQRLIFKNFYQTLEFRDSEFLDELHKLLDE